MCCATRRSHRTQERCSYHIGRMPRHHPVAHPSRYRGSDSKLSYCFANRRGFRLPHSQRPDCLLLYCGLRSEKHECHLPGGYLPCGNRCSRRYCPKPSCRSIGQTQRFRPIRCVKLCYPPRNSCWLRVPVECHQFVESSPPASCKRPRCSERYYI